MAEDLEAAGVCGGSWWLSSPRALLFPCSSAVLHDCPAWTNTESRGSRSPVSDQGWNQDMICSHGDGGVLGSYPLLTATAMDSGMKPRIHYPPAPAAMASFEEENSRFSSESASGFHLSSSSYAFAASLLEENLLEGDSSYMMNQGGYFGNLGMMDSTGLPVPENYLQFPGGFPANFTPSDQPQFLSQRSNYPNLNSQNPRVEAPAARKNAAADPPPKRQRIETPSPLPTFKVRKEKLGDRVTALQQLVSPFGKTDTASVLHEAIEYIKYLHDQVNVLSSPYFKSKSPPDQPQEAAQEGTKKGLRSRGLCLMPISSTYPVATESTSDFWAPSFVRSFRQ